MTRIYLLINALFYLLFTVWCLIKPEDTAGFLGYSFLNNSGKAEYLSIYTGLELGFTVFLALCAFYPNIRLAGLIFCVCIYVGVMIVRPASALYYGNISQVTYMVGGLEYALGIWGIILLINEIKKIN